VADKSDRGDGSGAFYNFISDEKNNEPKSGSPLKEFYPQRHLRPGNLSPLRKKLEKQLVDLKEVNQQSGYQPTGDPAGEYLNQNPILRGKN